MLAAVSDLTDGTIATLRVKAGPVANGEVVLTLLHPSADVTDETPIGSLTVDVVSGDVTGSITDVDADCADTLLLALEPGDVVLEPSLGLLVVQGVSPSGMWLTGLSGASVQTGSVRKVGHVDIEDLEL